MSTKFDSLALNPATLANLVQLGYLEMTPIQAASLPAALLGGPKTSHGGLNSKRSGRRHDIRGLVEK